MFPSSTSKEYEAVAVHFHPDVLKKIYENDLPKFLQQTKKVSTNTNLVKINTSPLFEKYIDGVLFYFENPDLVTEELLVLKLKELILLLNQTKDAPKMQQILSELFSPAIYSFKQIIDAHIFSDLSLEDLAQLTNLSVSSFKREFKKIYQDSPASYIKNKKLEHASELLIISDIRITNIAYDCGFNDIAHFSKSFQEKYSISPSNFRLSQKNKSLD